MTTSERTALLTTIADRIQASMGPVFGSPEYLADPVKLARAQKRQRDAAESWAAIALDAVLEATEPTIPAALAETQGRLALRTGECEAKQIIITQLEGDVSRLRALADGLAEALEEIVALARDATVLEVATAAKALSVYRTARDGGGM